MRPLARRIAALLCGIVLLAPVSAIGIPLPSFLIAVRDVTAGDGTAGDRYGYAVAVDSDTAVIGAPDKDVNQGAAYVIERNQGGSENWGEVKKLLPAVSTFNGFFGFAVAISGDTAAVGEPNTGHVYLFERDAGGSENWGLVKTLPPPASANFGYAIALDGDTLVVGSFDESVGPNAAQGAAYIFERNQGGSENWGQVQHLVAGDGAAQDLFGGAVAVKGDTAVVGAIGTDVGGHEDQGAAYIFDRDQGGSENWGQVKKLVAADGGVNDQLGASVAIDGDTVVAGAYLADVGSTDEGAAYVFERNSSGSNQWGQVKKLVASDPAPFLSFGRSVAISGDAVLVGAFPTGGIFFTFFNVGGVYLFERDLGGTENWGQFQKLLASTAFDPMHVPGHVSNNGIGDAVAISGATVVAGASQDDVGGNSVNQGSAYVFDAVSGPNPTIIGQSVTVGQGNSIGQTIAIVSDDVTPPGNLMVSLAGSPPAGIHVSGISNSFGRVTASVSADCTTAVSSYPVALQVQDGNGNTATANLTVNVTAHPTPTIGNYPNATVGFGATGTIIADAAPQEDGTPFNVASFVASAPGFAGTFSTNKFTGGVTVSNAGPAGNFTVTVTATDSCGVTATATFTLTVLSALAKVTVNTTSDTVADDGFCSLREAIIAASTNTASGTMPGECNAGLTGTDVIAFDIPGTGPHTITPGSPLPTNDEPVIIDGTTQPGASCTGWPPTLQIVLDGSSAGTNADGLTLNGDDSVVRGLVVQQFDRFGIAPRSANDTIQCNFIGTDATGTLARGNGQSGLGARIGVGVSFGTALIGGTDPSDRNLISGNGNGIDLHFGNKVLGNYIGTDVTGTHSLGNLGDGIVIDLAGIDNVIGGTFPEARNIISGNGRNGVNDGGFDGQTSGGFSNTIIGNFIGTDVTGTVALGNGTNGVSIGSAAAGANDSVTQNLISGNGAAGVRILGPFSFATVQSNLLGTDATGQLPLGNGEDGVLIAASALNQIGTASLALSGDATLANRIAFNGRDGVRITDSSSTDNLIGYNSIHDNAGLGIDLGGDGVTGNGANPRMFPNNGQNFPVFTGAVSNGITTTIDGIFTSIPSSDFTLQFFSNPACDPSGNGEGRTWLADVPLSTDAGGNASIHMTLPLAVLPGFQITATASGPDPSFGDLPETSEFSPCVPVTGVGADLAPAVTPQVITRQQGSTGSLATLGTTSDDLTAAADLTAMAITVPSGLSVSSIVNSNGTLDALVGASCTEPLGDTSFGVKVSDAAALMTTGNVIVHITPNTAPLLGTYADVGPLHAGTTAAVFPNAAPSDNGMVVTLAASAPGFGGSFDGDPLTGKVTMHNAGPVGSFTVTVTATDNCGLQSVTSFQLTVAPPVVAAAASHRVLLVITALLTAFGVARTGLRRRA